MRTWVFSVLIGLIACGKNDAGGPSKAFSENKTSGEESVYRENKKKDSAVENVLESRQIGVNAMGSVDSVGQLEYRLGNMNLVIFKVADAKRRPVGDYIGKAEFDKAQGDGMVLLYIVISADRGSVSLSQSKGGQWVPLPASNRVFRMPNSPFFTYAIVDLSEPVAIGLSTVQDLAKVDLPVSDLRSLSLHWSGETGTFSWQGIPKKFYESMLK